MTTVVFDGYTLAADKRSTKANTIHDCIHCGEITADGNVVKDKIIVPKKPLTFRDENVLAMACSGSSIYRKIISKLMTELPDLGNIVSIAMDLAPVGKFHVHFIILTDKRCYKIAIMDGTKVKELDFNKDIFIAIGSGAVAAEIGHKEFNLNAKASIEFASKYDPHTSKETTSFVYREYPKEISTSEVVQRVEKVVEKSVNEKNNTVKIKRDKDGVVTNIKGKNEKIKITHEDGISTVKRTTKRKVKVD